MFVFTVAEGGNNEQPKLSVTEPDTEIQPGKI